MAALLSSSQSSSATGPPGDRATVAAAIEVLSGTGKRRGLARLLPFPGPAIIASVAYVDPGNFATDLQSGSQLGYTLLWVVVTSNLMAMVIQTLSAKLGIATGHNLAEQCRLSLPRGLCLLLWGVMEIVAMATDLAEFLGAALGFHLLFGLPLGIAGLLTAVVTFLLLSLERYGFRRLELVIALLVASIAVSYLAELLLARPDWRQAAFHSVVPAFGGRKGVVLASGILGATVMPHVIFLHSALTQGRIVVAGLEEKKRLLRYETLDVVLALGLAGAINAAMLIMAACTFHAHGLVNVDAIEQAHLTLQPLLGLAAGTLFAIALFGCGPVEFGRGHHGRPGRHARLPGIAHSALGAAGGHHGACVAGHWTGGQPDPDAGVEPSRAEPCPAFRGRAAGRVLEAASA